MSPSSFQDKNIVVGVTGGIAAYKVCQLVSSLKKQGAGVDVVMTQNATRFVAPLTFQTLSSRPVVLNAFDAPQLWEVKHVALAKKADLMIIAPATANIIAKMANGIADDMLSTVLLATRAHPHSACHEHGHGKIPQRRKYRHPSKAGYHLWGLKGVCLPAGMRAKAA